MRLLIVYWLVSLYVMQEIFGHPFLDYGQGLFPQIFHIGEEMAQDYDRDSKTYSDYSHAQPVECQYGHRRWKNAYLVPRPEYTFKLACSNVMQFVPNIISSLITSLLPPPLASLPLPPAICPL